MKEGGTMCPNNKKEREAFCSGINVEEHKLSLLSIELNAIYNKGAYHTSSWLNNMLSISLRSARTY